jgi:YidC/Oxa1 family membrane protein insertase
MDIYAFGPIAALLDAAYAVLHNLTLFLDPFAAPNAAALAIVVLTVVLRLMLIPVGVSSARAQRMRQRLAPRLAELRRRYGTDTERLQRETMALYKAENASPLAGCLPLLVQAPVLSIVYGLFVLSDINGHDNDLLAGSLFGSPLGSSIVAGWGAGQAPVVLLVGGVLLVVLLVAQLLSRRLSLAQSAEAAGTATAVAAPPPSAAAMSPSAQAGLTRTLSWLPLISVVFAAVVPLAAAVYLTVSAIWSVSERALLRRLMQPGR